jgi:hypothetical protein
MKPHKHAELIKAWADGAVIEARYLKATGWTDWKEEVGGFIWYFEGAKYRIKPEPMPDVTYYFEVDRRKNVYQIDTIAGEANFTLTFDGETGKLKSAEVLK